MTTEKPPTQSMKQQSNRLAPPENESLVTNSALLPSTEMLTIRYRIVDGKDGFIRLQFSSFELDSSSSNETEGKGLGFYIQHFKKLNLTDAIKKTSISAPEGQQEKMPKIHGDTFRTKELAEVKANKYSPHLLRPITFRITDSAEVFHLDDLAEIIYEQDNSHGKFSDEGSDDMEVIAQQERVKKNRSRAEMPDPAKSWSADVNHKDAHYQSRVSREVADAIEAFRKASGYTKKQITETALRNFLEHYSPHP